MAQFMIVMERLTRRATVVEADTAAAAVAAAPFEWDTSDDDRLGEQNDIRIVSLEQLPETE
jgi:hypothetical protein